MIMLLGIFFRIMTEDPFGQTRSRLLHIELYFGPIGFLQKIGVGKTYLLAAGRSNEAEICLAQFSNDLRARRKLVDQGWTRYRLNVLTEI